MIWNTSELSASHLSRVSAIFVDDCCQFGPSLMFKLEMELMASPDWLAVPQSKALIFLILYDNINVITHFWTVCITPQPCHSHVCCWLIPIWPILDVWAEIGAYGLCQLGRRCNGAELCYYWSYMIVSMIWNTSEMSASHLSRATAFFVVDCCQFGPSWIFVLKMELMACADLVAGTTEQSCIFPDLIWYYQLYETLLKCLHLI